MDGLEGALLLYVLVEGADVELAAVDEEDEDENIEVGMSLFSGAKIEKEGEGPDARNPTTDAVMIDSISLASVMLSRLLACLLVDAYPSLSST